jgi:dTDP-4-dehydrorhamnose 3,5-epimerase
LIFQPTDLEGVYVIEVQPYVDERGMFARVFDEEAFCERGLKTQWPQCSVSFNPTKGTLRGMHFQRGEHAETKLIRCTQGAIYDVAIDLRPDSPTFHRWTAVELSAQSHRLFYIPEGCAHGFLSLQANSEVYYQISTPYCAEASAGVRWDDPAFGVRWPSQPVVMSPRDAAYEAVRAL